MIHYSGNVEALIPVYRWYFYIQKMFVFLKMYFIWLSIYCYGIDINCFGTALFISGMVRDLFGFSSLGR